jgi:hypothetical protein
VVYPELCPVLVACPELCPVLVVCLLEACHRLRCHLAPGLGMVKFFSSPYLLLLLPPVMGQDGCEQCGRVPVTLITVGDHC